MAIITIRTKANKPTLKDKIEAIKPYLDGDYGFRVVGHNVRGLRWKLIKIDEASGEIELEDPAGNQGTTQVDSVVWEPLSRPIKEKAEKPTLIAKNGKGKPDHGISVEKSATRQRAEETIRRAQAKKAAEEVTDSVSDTEEEINKLLEA